jgi:hypothetical protein
MAQQALSAAIADAGAAAARRTRINQGLVGAVLNALDKGMPEDEVRAALFEHGGIEAIRAAMDESPEMLSEPIREALRRLLLSNTQTAAAPEVQCDGS